MPRALRRGTVLLLLGLPLALCWGGSLPSDILYYRDYACQTLAGRVPYRDFPMEYPPVALLFFLPPAALQLRTPWAYGCGFIVLMGACDVLQRLLLLRRLPVARHLAMLGWAAGASSLLNYTYLKRFDVAAALLCSAAICALLRRPGGLSGWVWLSLAAGCKLYPAALAPLFWRYAADCGVGRRQRCRQVAAALAVVIAVAGACWSQAGAACVDWLSYHGDRGLHLGSHYTGLAMLWHGLGSRFPIDFAYGAFEVRAPWAAPCARWAPAALLTMLGLTYWRLAARPLDAHRLWAGSAAVVAALLMTSKVVSPQYFAWLVPLGSMAAATAPRPRAAAGFGVALLLACWCTAELWPHEQYLSCGVVRKQVFLLLRFVACGVIWWLACRPKRIVT